MSELRVVVTAFALLAAMFLAGLVGRRQRIGVVLLALLSIVWLNVDRDFEGPRLITVTADHGLVLADLIGIAGLAVAVWLWLVSRS